jgi:hypothetical protein
MKRTYFHNYKDFHELKRNGNPQDENKYMNVSSEDIKMNYFGMRKIFYFTFFIFLCFLFYSCEKSLDLVPQTTFSESTFFKTTDQYKLFTNQFYLSLPTTTYDLTRDSYADLTMTKTTNTVSNGSYVATPTSDTWTSSYQTIRNTTYLIGKGVNASSDLKDQVAIYVAEAEFFRALAYFNLFRDFGGVPIIDKVLTLGDKDLLYGPRNSRQEVVDYIMKDLDDAISVLPVESAIASDDKGRVSKGAALALEARIALFEGTWDEFRGITGYQTLLDKAINASNQIISSGEYELFDRRDVLGNESWRYFFFLDIKKSNFGNLTKTDQKENILVNRYDGTIRGVPQNSFTGGDCPTLKFADMFLCTDGLPIDKSPLFQGKLTNTSEYINRDLRMTNTMVVPYTQAWPGFMASTCRDWNNPYASGYPDGNAYHNIVTLGMATLTGYMDKKGVGEIFMPSYDLPVIRYAEVLLINAEALFEKNSSITDAQLDLTINKLRFRAGVAALSNAFVTSNGLDMRTEIRRERNVELFKEQQRWDDIRRWKTAETELTQSMRGVLWTGTYKTSPEYSNVIVNLDADGYLVVEDASIRKFDPDKNYLMPLPTRQLLLNPQLEQNPGW